ncbi:isoleucine--tRNA ligase [Candidatus Saccharibacteria bacterium 32-50-13]|nr:MAG: isoleucine--tRNA ligase [Candidatus Saccharibacteria bacterium 32-50-13]
MKFKHGTRRRALEYEKDWAQRWKQDKTFEKSVENRPADNAYVFYDGPPFITGVPHHGTLLSSIVKDAVPRYWTMKGKRVERVWGWDTHGLPAENFVEKQLNIVDRRQIVTSPDEKAPLDKDGNPLATISLEQYITKARESMVANAETWEDVVDRIGRWVDFKGAYKTMDKDFMESVWWAFKTLYEKGKIYEGEKVLMYDTRFATPVSKNEVTMDNDAYQTVTDPSLYAKFKLADSDAYVLAWTTTPWTLPANLMLAVSPDLTYCEVEVAGEKLVIAEEALERVLKDEKNKPLEYTVLRKFPGSELAGKSYQPLDTGSTWPESNAIHKIYAADFVSHESGTGIVHCAPAYGEDDFELGKANSIAAFHVIDDNGYYVDTNYRGLEVWDNNKFIAKDLMEKGIGWKIEYIRHEYPFNPRSGQRIMYRAIPSWFFDIQDSKSLMLEQNEHINWFPPHLKDGRFAKNIEQAPDWNLSRDRFWATAMPVWKGDNGTVKVIGSYAELKELSGVELDDYHRPWVDDITFAIDGEKFTRIDKVLDCWFESGSMPFAQLHYPFENKEKFEANYPADFIVEYVGQVRAWFYYVHAVNTALFGSEAFKNVITTGVVAGNDGRKMSKSLGNFTDPNELMDKFSADSLRFLLLSSPLLKGEDFALHDKDVGDVARKLSMVWNMYDFFTMYAEVDGWEFDSSKPFTLNPDNVTNPMDKWIISRVHQLNKQVTEDMDGYNLPDAMADILPFLDDASNWYVRRSRRRFWKSEDDGDKNEAYRTLHYVLLKLSALLAPFTPFLAEELYQNLGGGGESVHLLDWPTNYTVDQRVLDEMAEVRGYVNEGLSLRAKAGLKVRQPLASITVPSLGASIDFTPILLDELNVKEVRQGDEVAIDENLTPELRREGLMREVVRHVQAARKNVGLQVDDRINLHLLTEGAELAEAIAEHRDAIYAETLAVGDEVATTDAVMVKIEGTELAVSLEKA